MKLPKTLSALWSIPDDDESDPAILDGDARNVLSAISIAVGGVSGLHSFLLWHRRREASRLAAQRMADWRAKCGRYFSDADKTSGVDSPYDQMVEPIRGPAIPKPYVRKFALSPTTTWEALRAKEALEKSAAALLPDVPRIPRQNKVKS
jgi:hypothetical protein